MLPNILHKFFNNQFKVTAQIYSKYSHVYLEQNAKDLNKLIYDNGSDYNYARYVNGKIDDLMYSFLTGLTSNLVVDELKLNDNDKIFKILSCKKISKKNNLIPIKIMINNNNFDLAHFSKVQKIHNIKIQTLINKNEKKLAIDCYNQIELAVININKILKTNFLSMTNAKIDEYRHISKFQLSAYIFFIILMIIMIFDYKKFRALILKDFSIFK